MSDKYSVGKSHNIEDLDYSLACEIYGQKIVDEYYKTKSFLNNKMKVIDVDQDSKTITVGVDDE